MNDFAGTTLPLSARLQQAGVSLHHRFEPGELGELIRQHGVQNRSDYGFNEVHEAYCARIAADFVLNPEPGRSRLWLARQSGAVIGSVFICECPGDAAQLRLLFVDAPARGLGLGRWLVEEAVAYCRAAAFKRVFLWTVEGLDRAASVYTSLGFTISESKANHDWRGQARELRYDLQL